MRVEFKIPASESTLTALLEGLCAVNCVLLRRRQLPPLYKSGVRYKRERPGREKWLTAPETLAAGVGDCEDLAAWRCAELRVYKGEPARAIAMRSGKKKFHAVVQRADGRIEDPSRRLGMEKIKPWQQS